MLRQLVCRQTTPVGPSVRRALSLYAGRAAVATPRPTAPRLARKLCSGQSVAAEPPQSLRMRIAESISLPRLGLSWIVHVGNSIFLYSIFQTDMLQLRAMAVAGTLFNVCFLALQPVPLISSAVWSTFFTSTHLYQMYVLAKEKQATTLSAKEERVYELAFLPYGLCAWLPAHRPCSCASSASSHALWPCACLLLCSARPGSISISSIGAWGGGARIARATPSKRREKRCRRYTRTQKACLLHGSSGLTFPVRPSC